MNTSAVIATRGETLQLQATSAELADHLWQRRGELLRLTGSQRLQLLLELEDGDRLELHWAPEELPPSLFPARRPRRGLTP